MFPLLPFSSPYHTLADHAPKHPLNYNFYFYFYSPPLNLFLSFPPLSITIVLDFCHLSTIIGHHFFTKSPPYHHQNLPSSSWSLLSQCCYATSILLSCRRHATIANFQFFLPFSPSFHPLAGNEIFIHINIY